MLSPLLTPLRSGSGRREMMGGDTWMGDHLLLASLVADVQLHG